MSSPEAVARGLQLSRTLVEAGHPDISEALALSPDETDRLLDLLATHRESTRAVFNSEDNGPSAVEERTVALRERQRVQEAELQAMLGSKYAQWQDYKETLPVWRQRQELRTVLEAAGAPLNDTQARSLIGALVVEQRSINQQSREVASPGKSTAEIFAQHTTERDERLLQAATPHLSPQQLKSYRNMLEGAASQERAFLRQTQPMRSEAAATPH